MGLGEDREMKARALREAASELVTRKSDDGRWSDQDQYAKWLSVRADQIDQGNDPAVPPEPLTAGSLAFTRDGGKYLRWCDGNSHTVSPWLRTMEHAEDFYRYADLDVVRVIAGPEEWPT